MARILVVEDENLVAMQVTWMIEDAGHFVVGPERCVAATREVLAQRDVDLAVLDVKLGSETVFPVAEMLDGLGVPYIFLSGQGASDIPVQYRHQPFLAKPCRPEVLVECIRQVLGRHGITDQRCDHTFGTVAERASAASSPPPDAMKAWR